MVIRGSVNSIRFIFEAIRPYSVVCSNDGTFRRQGVQVMTNREIVLRAFSNRVGNLYKQAEGDDSEGQSDFIGKALRGITSGVKGYANSAMEGSRNATMNALGRFQALDPTAQAAILGGLGGAGVGGIGNAVLGNKKKSLIRRLGEGAGVGGVAGAGVGALGQLGKANIYDPIKKKYIDPGISEVGRVLGKNKDKLEKGVGKAKDKVMSETGKIKDKAMGAVNSAKDSVVGAANSVKDKAVGAANSVKDKAVSGANYLSDKAKELQYRLGFGSKLNSDSPTNLDLASSVYDPSDDQNMSNNAELIRSLQEKSEGPIAGLQALSRGAHGQAQRFGDKLLNTFSKDDVIRNMKPDGTFRNITESGGLSSFRDPNAGLSRLLGNPAESAPFLTDEAGISQNLKSIGRQRNPNMNLGDFPSSGRSRL
jgi:hypothetical protein